MAADEYARPPQYTAGVGAGPRELAFYLEASKTANAAPVVPLHRTLLGLVPDLSVRVTS